MRNLLFLFLVIVLLISGCASRVDKTTESPLPASSEPEETGEPAIPPVISYEDNVYFILVDRFNDGVANLPDVDKNDLNAYQGGDLQGIIQKLDYIKGLGMTTIWLSPIMDNAPLGYHGYWVHDFYAVDEHFGSLDDFKTLVNEAHKRDMKIILDYVVNHTGKDMEWLSAPDKQDWFHENKTITNWNDKEQLINGWIYGLPDLNQENPEVRDYLVDNAKWWITETGIDGFRLDTVRHVSDEFWLYFINKIKTEFPEFYLLGEVWHHNARVLKVFQNLGMDGITNYSLYNGFDETFGPYGDMTVFAKYLRDESVFTDASLNSIFIDNHDNPRFYDSSEEYGKEFTKQALTFMYTYPAVSTLYYGTESLLEGDHDPANRLFMPWDKEGELVPFITGLADIKSTYLEEFEVISYNKKNLAYKISKGGNELLIIMNIDSKVSTVDVPVTGVFENYYSKETVESTGTLSLNMEPVSTLIFIIR